MGEQVGAGFVKRIQNCGGVAQLGEHLPCKQGVKSSNLSVSIVQEEMKDILFAQLTGAYSSAG